MSRSLAFVGILAMIAGAGSQSAVGQVDGGQTSQGLVVQNHMSDDERDRLMKEAMEKARRQLDKQKAEEQAAMKKAADQEKESEAQRKAREEELAKKLAAEEKARETAPPMELAPLKTETAGKDLDKEPKVTEAQKTAEAKSKTETASAKAESVKAKEPGKSADTDKSKDDEKKSVAKSSDTKSEQKSENKKVATSSKSEEKAPARSKDNGEPTDLAKAEEIEQATIARVSTNDPGAGLTVKSSMPRASDSRGDSMTINGRVVGMMHSTNDRPRILVQSEDRRMVQVVLENDREMPAPGSEVSVRGRNIGGSGSRLVISASSVSIKSGGPVKVPGAVAAVPGPPAPIGPMAPLPPPPVAVVGPPPFPIGPGPMPMLPPPPPF